MKECKLTKWSFAILGIPFDIAGKVRTGYIRKPLTWLLMILWIPIMGHVGVLLALFGLIYDMSSEM